MSTKTKAHPTASIVVDDRLVNIFNLVKGALGCRSEELFEEIMEFYLENQFQSRLEERNQIFSNAIERLREESEEIKETGHKAEAIVEIKQ